MFMWSLVTWSTKCAKVATRMMLKGDDTLAILGTWDHDIGDSCEVVHPSEARLFLVLMRQCQPWDPHS